MKTHDEMLYDILEKAISDVQVMKELLIEVIEINKVMLHKLDFLESKERSLLMQ